MPRTLQQKTEFRIYSSAKTISLIQCFFWHLFHSLTAIAPTDVGAPIRAGFARSRDQCWLHIWSASTPLTRTLGSGSDPGRCYFHFDKASCWRRRTVAVAARTDHSRQRTDMAPSRLARRAAGLIRAPAAPLLEATSSDRFARAGRLQRAGSNPAAPAAARRTQTGPARHASPPGPPAGPPAPLRASRPGPGCPRTPRSHVRPPRRLYATAAGPRKARRRPTDGERARGPPLDATALVRAAGRARRGLPGPRGL